MASGPPGGGGESTATATATAPAPAPAPTSPSAAPVVPAAKPRWSSESKVYYRKSHKNPKPQPNPNPNANPNPNPPRPISSAQTLPSPPPPPLPPPQQHEEAAPAAAAAPSPPAPSPPQPPPAVVTVSDDASGGVPNAHGEAAITKLRARHERRELRRRLSAELEQVRALSKRLDEAAAAMATAAAATAPDTGYAHSQFSATEPETPVPTPVSAVAPAPTLLSRRPLTVSVMPVESFEKEKRTPKANQYYHNSEFLLAKDKFPPADSHSHKKSKVNGGKKYHRHHVDAVEFAAERRLYSNAFKKCSSLLTRLMKHKFGWVFNEPVDPIKLGLLDYFAIIKHPMDLGTIKGHLSRGRYRSPREFAEDVRLTFRNAMTYNPKGQDVHFMAEQMLGIFEAQWPAIEAEVEYLEACPPLPKKVPPPPIDMRVLERSNSTMHMVSLDSKSRLVSHVSYTGRPAALKKPKAKDPDKREMTIEEKRKLSNNLQNLPPERLDLVVQIIRNKNLLLSQHDDEIEVDIDCMDTETLWELDRFVMNYKKNLSKHKRKAERAMLARQNAEQNAQRVVQERSQQPKVGESPKQNAVADEQLASSVPAQDGKNGENMSRSSSSSSSSSDSGSSSSDSDSDSSSGDGSDAANSS